jgi:hypothetical protein
VLTGARRHHCGGCTSRVARSCRVVLSSAAGVAARSSVSARARERRRALALAPRPETRPETRRTTWMYRSCHHRCSRRTLARGRRRRQLRRPVSPSDRAPRGSRLRRVARPRQVPAASCPCHLPPARRQLRERFRRHWVRDRRRSRRVRERTRPATPTRRARTARRASSWTEPGCVATVGLRPIQPWISQRWISGAPCLSRSSSSDPRTSPPSNHPRTTPPSEPPVAVSPSDDQSNDTQNIPQAAVQRRLVGYTDTPRLERTRPPGSQPTKRNLRGVYVEVSEL